MSLINEYGLSLGAELSPYDPRIYPVSAVIPTTKYPDDYESPDLGVSDQGSVGRCVAESVIACLEEFFYEETDIIVRLSRDFFYQNRDPEQYKGQGMYSSEACDNSRKKGAPWVSVCPDILREFTPGIKYADNILNNAYDQRSITTCRAKNIDELKNAVSKPKTAAFIVIPVYRSFVEYKSGILQLPNKSTEKFYGYHAMKIADYHKDVIVPKNSWGSGWGEKGKVNLPLDYPMVETWIITDYSPRYDVLEMFIGKDYMIYNGEKCNIDMPPIIKNKRTLTPARATHEVFNDIVKWDAQNEKITIMRPRIPRT